MRQLMCEHLFIFVTCHSRVFLKVRPWVSPQVHHILSTRELSFKSTHKALIMRPLLQLGRNYKYMYKKCAGGLVCVYSAHVNSFTYDSLNTTRVAK